MAMFLTTVMSLGLRVLRLLMADWRAGIASARSFSQSSLEVFDVVIVVEIARSFVTTTRMKIRSILVGGECAEEDNITLKMLMVQMDPIKLMITVIHIIHNIDGDLIA